MMPHVALLRGINVGGTARIAMSDLVALSRALGFQDARTILQSGNLVFRSDPARGGEELESLLRRAIADRLGHEVEVLVRTADEWSGIIAANPFPAAASDDPSHLLVMALTREPEERAVDALRAAIEGPETIAAVGRQLYVVYPAGIGRSALTGARIEARLATRGTGRNWNTVLRIRALVQAPAPG